jgi:hypothetical protein
VEEVELRGLVDEALAATRRDPSPEGYEAAWDRIRLAAASGSPAVELAAHLAESPDPVDRAIACDLLGAVCNGHDYTHRPVAEALVDIAKHETDPQVLRSLAAALHHASDPVALSTLVALAGHANSTIRLEVAIALPANLAESANDNGVAALMALGADPDAEVRNWATFGVARCLDADGTDIRTALWDRVTDPDGDVREEAICGLARRRAPGARRLVADLLAAGGVHDWAFEAAVWIGHGSLLPLLDPYPPDKTERARRLCDPDWRRARDDACAQLLSSIQVVLDQRPGRPSASLLCDLREDGAPLLRIGGGDQTWFVEAVLEAANNDIAAATARVIDQVDAADRN